MKAKQKNLCVLCVFAANDIIQIFPKIFLSIVLLAVVGRTRGGGHIREEPERHWIPASAGMTASGNNNAAWNSESGSTVPAEADISGKNPKDAGFPLPQE